MVAKLVETGGVDLHLMPIHYIEISRFTNIKHGYYHMIRGKKQRMDSR